MLRRQIGPGPCWSQTDCEADVPVGLVERPFCVLPGNSEQGVHWRVFLISVGDGGPYSIPPVIGSVSVARKEVQGGERGEEVKPHEGEGGSH